MVAHTGNSTMTTASSTTLPTTNYLSAPMKMSLPQNLRMLFSEKIENRFEIH